MQPTVAEEQIGVQGFVSVMCLVPGRNNTCNNQYTLETLLTIQEWASNGHECICKGHRCAWCIMWTGIELRGYDSTWLSSWCGSHSEREFWWPAGYRTCPGLPVMPVQQ